MRAIFKTFLLSLAIFLLFLPLAHAQSTLEVSQKIKERSDAALNRFRGKLSELLTDPSNFQELSKVAEMSKSELQSLDGEINSQIEIITKKETSLASAALSEGDRKELQSALASQKKPLASLKSSNLAWEKIFEDFNTTTLQQWQNIYSSYSEIAGPDKARAKVAEKVSAYDSTLPWPGSNEGKSKPENDQIKTQPRTTAPATIDPVTMNIASLRASAKTGNPAAECELGMRYKMGTEIQRDSDQAVYWLTRAAEKGNAEAQLTLGKMYRNGEGVSMNYQIAKKWLTKAAASGSQYAKSLLREM